MKDLIKVIIIGILGGALPVFIKIGVSVMPPQTFIFLRYFLALLVLLPIYFYKKEKLVNKKQFIIVAIFAYFNIFFAAIGIKLTSPIMSQMLYSCIPIITTILAYFILKNKITKKQIIGILIGFIGAFVIIILPAFNKNAIPTGSLQGNLIVGLAVMSYATYTIISKKIQKNNSSLSVMTNIALFTFVLQLFIVPFEYSKINIAAIISPNILFAIFYTGVIGTAIYHFLYLNLIKTAGPIIASLVLYVQPIFTIIWAIVLLGESLSLFLVIGSIFVFIGAYLVSQK